MSGGNIIGASYLLFVEDTNDDGIGEIYLLKDIEGDGKFDEYGPGQPYDYRNYKITETFTVRCYYGLPPIPPTQIGSDQTITLGSGKQTESRNILD